MKNPVSFAQVWIFTRHLLRGVCGGVRGNCFERTTVSSLERNQSGDRRREREERNVRY
jgi:hypothetical protein